MENMKSTRIHLEKAKRNLHWANIRRFNESMKRYTCFWAWFKRRLKDVGYGCKRIEKRLRISDLSRESFSKFYGHFIAWKSSKSESHDRQDGCSSS